MSSTEAVSAEPSYRGLYIATVEDNNFPGTQKIGECRVRVNGMPGQGPEVSVDELPVAIFFRSQFNTQFGTFPIGATVAVTFQNGDPMAPIITGRMLTATDKAEIAALFPEYASDYPNVYGWVDGDGTGFMMNKASGTLKVIHKSGFQAEVTGAGDLNAVIPGNLMAQITGDADAVVGGNLTATVTGDLTANVTGNVAVDATGMIELTSAVQIKLMAPMILEN